MEDAVKNTASLTTVFFEAGFLCLNLAVLGLALKAERRSPDMYKDYFCGQECPKGKSVSLAAISAEGEGKA